MKRKFICTLIYECYKTDGDEVNKLTILPLKTFISRQLGHSNLIQTKSYEMNISNNVGSLLLPKLKHEYTGRACGKLTL